MSTNHNRIKVADLEINQPNRILTTNTFGELEFSDINNIKTDCYNALDYSIAGKALDARQGKILKDLIDNINALLASYNVNLDTVQELVDAIETVQISLNTILVNDLITGGTVKALTAEMGKTLKALYDSLSINKVDKIVGERLINTAEITKLAGLGNLTTTVKPISSTVLATQNVAGLVTYINALTPVLVINTNETVTYKITNSGRVFELLLRGRSFGVGQPAIVAADVIEVTEFLNKDITLSNYPSTRNDGQLSSNKVLSTDANGNIKLYTIATAQAPFIFELIPDSHLPNTTGNIELIGDFFVPAMCLSPNLNNGNGIQITGQTINYASFINSQKILINVTTGASEGYFSITCNNGLSTTKTNALLIIGGTIYKPINSEWVNKALVTTDNDEVNLINYGSYSSNAEWTRIFDYTKNWEFRIRLKRSPLGTYVGGNDYGSSPFYLKKVTANTSFAYGQLYMNAAQSNGSFIVTTPNHVKIVSSANVSVSVSGIAGLETLELKLKYQGGVLYAYNGATLLFTFSDVLTENLRLVVKPTYYDWTGIKYIELP
ncbi:hypothetical protein CLU83_1952 [Flavobacterium sp. 1]|uniref:hypothetical protein n=1 Tax=Flavobacterium sp. 1 TaxID=2035200 RepID=UPI000C2452D2|nr:hypothetical protein [Flavobacterium sp. 1]PJJ08666.1 hypothetical protein CLU83_1952 [Flavobacterium sp. 1]